MSGGLSIVGARCLLFCAAHLSAVFMRCFGIQEVLDAVGDHQVLSCPAVVSVVQNIVCFCGHIFAAVLRIFRGVLVFSCCILGQFFCSPE